MDSLFVYDDCTRISFYVETNQGDLAARIERHGGRLASAFEARFHIVALVGAIMPPKDPTVLVLQARWVVESIRERRMLPIYPYLKNPDQDSLNYLSLEDRDIAELLKAKIWNTGDGVFTQLHMKFPHNTTDDWRTLYQNAQVAILTALARIASPNQEQLNRLILPIFPPPAVPVGQRPPRDVDIRDQDHAVRAPSEDQDDVMVEREYFDRMEQRDDRTGSESIAQLPPASASSFVDQQPDFIDDPEEDRGDGEYAEEDNGTEYADSGRPLSPSETPPLRQQSRNGPSTRRDVKLTGRPLSPSETPPPRNRRLRNGPPTRRGVIFTTDHRDAMVRFLRDLDRDPIAADWKDFRDLTPENRVRSADAWRNKFHKDRKNILADVHHLRAQGA